MTSTSRARARPAVPSRWVAALATLLLVGLVLPVAAATPDAVDDAYTTPQDQTLVVDAPGVLGNDTVDGANLALESGPTDGTLSLDADGSFTYTPDAGFAGADSFTYSLTGDAGTSSISLGDIDPGSDDGIVSAQTRWADGADLGGPVVFAADDGTSGWEPWVADGTFGSARLLRDINPSGNGLPQAHAGFTVFDGYAWFVADDGSGQQVWRTDGTAAGTESPFELTGSSTTVGALTISGGRLYFPAKGAIWTLGSATGTPTKLVEGGSIAAAYQDGVLLYAETDPATGNELHFTNGGPPELVADLVSGSGSSAVGTVTTHGTDVWFVARSDDSGFDSYLWHWDGQQLFDGTNHVDLVLERNPGLLQAGPGVVYELGSGTVRSLQVHEVTSTSATSTTLIDGLSGVRAFGPMRVAGPQLVFTADEAATGREPWVTDGTIAGTGIVADVNPGSADGYGSYVGNGMSSVDGLVYFGGDDGATGTEVWSSDGTAPGTQRRTDVNASGGSLPVGYSDYGDGVLFWADDGTTGHEPHVLGAAGATSDQATVTITVQDATDDPPVIEPIADQSVDEQTRLLVEPVITDPDGDPFTLTWGGDVPDNAIINGVFDWTPDESQGPGDYTISVTATQDDDPTLSTTETFAVAVAEVDEPPVLDPVGDRAATVGEELTFVATASDPDVPTETLAFSLDGAVPAGATITSGGAFSWTPTVDDVGDHTFDVVVSDGDLEDRETITVTVSEATTTILLTVQEGVGVADEVRVAPPVAIELTEGIGVGDTVDLTPAVQLVVGEGVGVADEVPVDPPVVIELTEGIGVDDAVTLTTLSDGLLLDGDELVGEALMGETYTVTGDGFAPGAEVTLQLFSDPVPLGTTTTDTTGAFSSTVTIPPTTPGDHTVVASGAGPTGIPHEARAPVTVVAPADIDLQDVPDRIRAPGGDAPDFHLTAEVSSPVEGLDVANGDPTIRLVPIVPGTDVEGDCDLDGDLLRCVFSDVPVNGWIAQATIGFPFAGSDQDVLLLDDPKRGSTHGTGHFTWPGTQAATARGAGDASLAYNVRYDPFGTARGHLHVARRLGRGSGITHASVTRLHGAALGPADAEKPWAVIMGDAVVLPGHSGSAGTLVVYVEDGGDDGQDRAWVKLFATAGVDGATVLSSPGPAPNEAVPIARGNLRITPPWTLSWR